MKTISIEATRISPKRTTVATGNGEYTIGREGSPLEYLLGSLAGCFNVVGTILADEMGIDIEDLEIGIEGDVDTRRYTGESTDPRAGFQDVRVTVRIESDADRDTLQEWIAAVSDRCPVADNLQNETSVGVTLDARSD
ncbi:MAG: OsmC family protein [Halodesulfurarchaeum sp.]